MTIIKNIHNENISNIIIYYIIRNLCTNTKNENLKTKNSFHIHLKEIS